MDEDKPFSESEMQWVRERVPVARQALLANLRQFGQHPVPLLLAGDVYSGIWLEHNQDNVFLAEYRPESAWASQQVFMDYQREDGLLPFMFPLQAQGGYFDVTAAYWHIQSVYPFARCAMEVADRVGRDEETYAAIYAAAARFDDWLATHRNRRGTGLAEMYCEWDVGHDNDPRVTDGGIPHTCPGKDARNMPDLPCMPVLSVDLSAMMYGGRVALAELAGRLGKGAEQERWRAKAEELRSRIREHLYDPEDDFYYDRDANGFRKYRSEHITRLFLNGVLEQAEFDRIYDRYFTDEKEFWPAYPIPAMSVSDPSFVASCPRNCWGANSQALTALRALFWMPRYGREKELRELLFRWLKAFAKYENGFTQEINPFDGSPIGTGANYSPSLILLIEAARRHGLAELTPRS